MKKYILLAASCLFFMAAGAQSNISFLVRDAKTRDPLPGATVAISPMGKSAAANAEGKALFNAIPDGRYAVSARFVGYETKTDSITLPIAGGVFDVFLEPSEADELDEVMVSSTRSTRTISAIPTRVEVIAGEELDEKGNMKPGDIRMILNESTGIQTQQTSATSANASIRIQGLDGRYTQMLKDGFPVYSGAASGLGLLQTPPLDLRQVEVIKGSASTLYGGGAIAGLVNLISKTPGENPELNFMLNGTSAGGLDLNGFYAAKHGAAGITLFAARNSNKPFAPGSVDFTAIPEFERYTLNPKLFLTISPRTSLVAGLNGSMEDRTGGDLHYIRGNGDATHSYFEKNRSRRLSSQLNINHRFDEGKQLSLRNSLSFFNRRIYTPGYTFDGSQYGSFSEATFSVDKEHTEWIFGANLVSDHFSENQQTAVPRRDYSQVTGGLFVQNSAHLAEWLEMESGLRGDYVTDYGFVLLPRISALFKITKKFSSRLGGGLGYKTPTLFTEESERIQYRNVLAISAQNTFERSYGVNGDVNYRTSLSDLATLSVNQLFFYTRLQNPLMMQAASSGQFVFNNVNGHFDSRGMETNVKLTYSDFKLFIGYTLTDARLHTGSGVMQNPLTAKHRLNNVLMYEAEDQWKLGLEAYYYSRQHLTDGALGKPYWITGFMAERLWERFSLYINFENFMDTRQTRFDTIYTGTQASPVFRDIYAPLDGFVVNGGIKLRL